MISFWYGARDVFHFPGSAEMPEDSMRYLSAHSLTVISGRGSRPRCEIYCHSRTLFLLAIDDFLLQILLRRVFCKLAELFLDFLREHLVDFFSLQPLKDRR